MREPRKVESSSGSIYYLSGEYNYKLEDDGSVLIKYTGEEMFVELPLEIDEYPVVGLGEGSHFTFDGNVKRGIFEHGNVYKAVLFENMTKIGKNIFTG